MADTVNPSSGSDADYEKSAMDILSEGSEETNENTPTEEPSEEESTEELPESDSTEETPDVPETEQEEELPEPELEPEPEPKDDQLTLSGKEAYDKLKKEFPEALKNNPALRQVFFREKAFSDIYTSVDEAKQANEDAEFLAGMGAAINNGNVASVISSLSDKAKEQLAEHFIPALMKVDGKLFVRATGPLIANILNDAFEAGDTHNNKNLQNAVLHVAKFLTGKFELPKRLGEKKVDKELETARQTFLQEKEAFYQTQATNFLDSSDKAVESALTKLVGTGLDPSNEMSQFVKNAIIAETLKDIKNYVSQDKAFAATLNSNFSRAQRTGFNSESKSRMISAYLGRVKDIALKIRAKHVSNARKTAGPTPENESRQTIRRESPDKGKRGSERRTSVPTKEPMSELDLIRAR